MVITILKVSRYFYNIFEVRWSEIELDKIDLECA